MSSPKMLLKICNHGTSDCPTVKNLPANAGDAGLIPGSEDPSCPIAAKPGSCNY